MSIIIYLFLLSLLFLGFYLANTLAVYFAPDYWVQDKLFNLVALKSKKRHPGFVGKPIKISLDTHRIARDKDGSLIRVENG